MEIALTVIAGVGLLIWLSFLVALVMRQVAGIRAESKPLPSGTDGFKAFKWGSPQREWVSGAKLGTLFGSGYLAGGGHGCDGGFQGQCGGHGGHCGGHGGGGHGG